MKHLLQRSLKAIRYAERDFERWRIFITLDGDNSLAGGEDQVGEVLRSHRVLGSLLSNGVTNM